MKKKKKNVIAVYNQTKFILFLSYLSSCFFGNYSSVYDYDTDVFFWTQKRFSLHGQVVSGSEPQNICYTLSAQKQTSPHNTLQGNTQHTHTPSLYTKKPQNFPVFTFFFQKKTKKGFTIASMSPFPQGSDAQGLLPMSELDELLNELGSMNGLGPIGASSTTTAEPAQPDMGLQVSDLPADFFSAIQSELALETAPAPLMPLTKEITPITHKDNLHAFSFGNDPTPHTVHMHPDPMIQSLTEALQRQTAPITPIAPMQYNTTVPPTAVTPSRPTHVVSQVPQVAVEAVETPVSAGGSWGASVMDWSSYAFQDGAGQQQKALPPRSSPDAHSSSTKMSSEGSIGSGSASVPQPQGAPGGVVTEAEGDDLDRPKGAPQVDLAKFRTKVCRAWASGQTCQFAERCAFAHGRDQMRTSEEHNPYMDVYGKKQARERAEAAAAAAAAASASLGGSTSSSGTAAGQTIGGAIQRFRAQKNSLSWNTPVPVAGIPLAPSYQGRTVKDAATFGPAADAGGPQDDQFTDQSGCVWFGN